MNTSKVALLTVCLSSVIHAMNPSIDQVLAISELLEIIFTHLDPASVRTAALVSR